MRKERLACVLGGVWLAATAATAGPIPRPAPEIGIQTAAAKPVTPGQYKGKVVALAFILTACPHCQKTVGYLSKMQTEYGPRGFQALASAVEDMAAMNLPDFLKRFQPNFPVGFDDRTKALEFLQLPTNVQLFMPQIVFIDRQGMIRAQHPGEDKFFSGDQEKNMRDQIEALLSEPAPPPKRTAGAGTRKKS